jgi:hypothetical protein
MKVKLAERNWVVAVTLITGLIGTADILFDVGIVSWLLSRTNELIIFLGSPLTVPSWCFLTLAFLTSLLFINKFFASLSSISFTYEEYIQFEGVKFLVKHSKGETAHVGECVCGVCGGQITIVLHRHPGHIILCENGHEVGKYSNYKEILPDRVVISAFKQEVKEAFVLHEKLNLTGNIPQRRSK